MLLTRSDAFDPWTPIEIETADDPAEAVVRWSQSQLETEPTIRRTKRQDDRIVLLADLDHSNPTPAGYAWKHPTVLTADDPNWHRYRVVAPDVEAIRHDDIHGSTWLSIRALEILRDRAHTATTMAPLTADARALVTARASMAALANRINRVMATADCPTMVARAARKEIDTAITADARAGAYTAPILTDQRILTMSRSGTVVHAVTAATPEQVIVLESRPGGEGLTVAESLRSRDLEVDVYPDAALFEAMQRVDVVLVGADTITATGVVLNKIGTQLVALAAQSAGVPVIVAASVDKVEMSDRQLDREPVTWSPANGHETAIPRFDLTSPDLLHAIVTELGVHAPADIDAIVHQLKENRRWFRTSGGTA